MSRRYKAIFFDLDGTLLTPEYKVPNGVLEQIALLKKHGFRVSVATGRSFKSAAPFLKILNIEESAVYFNGAVFHNPTTNQLELVDYIKEPDISQLISALKKQNISFKIQALDGSTYCDDVKGWPVHAISSNIEQPLPYHSSSPKLAAFKLTILCFEDQEASLRKFLLQDIPSFLDENHIFRTAYYALEVSRKSVNKSNSAKILLDYWNIPRDCAVAVGDQQNDYEMIRDFGLGVSIIGGFAGNHEVSKLQIPPPAENGIQILAEHLLKNFS